MTVLELRNKINIVFNNAYSVQVYLVLKVDQKLEMRLADIDSNTAPEIKALFTSYINDLIINNEDLELCELSTADERIGAIYRYDFEEYPEELGLFKDFDIVKTVREVAKFNFETDDLSTLYGYIIYLGSMHNGIVLFKKHYPISLIKRDAFLLGAVKSKQRFVKVPGSDILRLNSTSQIIRLEDEIFITDIKVLERNFGFTQLILKAAEDTIQIIDDLLLLEDIQVLRDAAEESAFARKLSKVRGYSPIIKLKIPRETVIEFTKSTPVLAGKFKYTNDGSMIRLDTKKSKEAFIKLMNDAFLRSELTKQYYEAKAKDTIT